MMKTIPMFNPGDEVRLIDGTPATVVSKADRKNYYIVNSAIHGRGVRIFAGDMEIRKED